MRRGMTAHKRLYTPRERVPVAFIYTDASCPSDLPGGGEGWRLGLYRIVKVHTGLDN